MWFLPTRGRPQQCQQLIEAMKACGDVPEVAVMIDDQPKVYRDVEWPAHWHIHIAEEHLEMTRALNTLRAIYRDKPFYGFFGDHFRPLTAWSKPLEDAAADWFMAWPCDDRSSDKQPAGAPTFGGKLIKALGWICLPSTVHVCTDRVWWFIWKDLGICRHIETSKFTRTWPLGEGGIPRNYKGRDYNAHDMDAYHKWEAEHGQQMIRTIRDAMMADGYEFENGVIAPKYGCAPFKAGW